MPAVELREVSYAYGDAVALDAVGFEVSPGSFSALIGPNGSGKTTCLRILVGLLEPRRGSVRIFGRPADEHAGPVGYVPQRTAIPPGFPLTVLDVVLMGRFGRLGLVRRPGSRDRDEARAALEQVGLAGLAGRRFGDLSGGQQQRVLIARALAGHPELLLLDEPTAGLDPAARAGFYTLLCDLQWEAGLTVLTASHDVEVVGKHADTIILLDGTVLAVGPPDEVLTRETLGEAYAFPPEHEHPERRKLRLRRGRDGRTPGLRGGGG